MPEPPPLPEPRMHDHPCKLCPSAHYPPDEESAEIATWPHEERVRTAFGCGWNQRRYCRGYCDQMGITNDDLAKLTEERAQERKTAGC